MIKIKKIIFILLIFIILANPVYAYRANMKTRIYDANISENEILVSNENELGIVKDAVVYSKPSSVYEFFDENDCINIVYATETNVYWSVYNWKHLLTKTSNTKVIYNKDETDEIYRSLTFNVGGYIYYNKHLYIIYARPVKNPDSNALALVKYDNNFNEIDKIQIKAKDVNSNIENDKSGMQFPFYGANCSLAINQNTNVLAVLFGKNRFDGKQDSSLLFFDLQSMEFLNNTEKYKKASSHSVQASLGQRIIMTQDAEFLLAESGDLNKTRGLNITQINYNNQPALTSKIMFNYKEGKNEVFGNNSTYQVLGNIIELKDSYLYIGASEKTLDVNYGNTINESWNIFMQKYEKTNFESKSVKDLQMFEEPLRRASVANPIKKIGKLFLNGNEIDYGVKWLTDLDNKSTVVFIRAVKIKNDNIFIIWQETGLKKIGENYGYDYDDTSLPTYYMIVDENGETIQPKTSISSAGKLSVEEEYLYKNGKIYWTTVNKRLNIIKLHILDIDNPYEFDFYDVKSTAWYADSINYLYKNKYIDGISPTEFGINEEVTKELLVSTLYNIEGKPDVKDFKIADVDSSSANYNAINWAISNNIISLDSNGNFNKDESLTTEKFITSLYKYACYRNLKINLNYDITVARDFKKISEYAKIPYNWALSGHILTMKNDVLEPQHIVKKAKMATIIANFCNNILK